jgi:hypothetical protein
MLRDPNSTFRYTPAVATDIRKTFKRIKRQQAEAMAAQQAAIAPPLTTAPAKAEQHVVPMRRPRSAP